MARRMEQVFERLFGRCEVVGECHLFKGTIVRGYGQTFFEGRRYYAHILSWYLQTGTWPTQKVLHKCNVKNCIRFDHLYQGTQKQNMQQASEDGLLLSGYTHPKAVITPEKLFVIALMQDEWTDRKLAQVLGISRGTVQAVTSGRTKWLVA